MRELPGLRKHMAVKAAAPVPAASDEQTALVSAPTDSPLKSLLAA